MNEIGNDRFICDDTSTEPGLSVNDLVVVQDEAFAVFDPKNVRTVAPGRLAFVAAKKCRPGDPLCCKKTPSVNGAFSNDEESVSLHFARLS